MRTLSPKKMLLTTVIALSSIPVSVYAAEENPTMTTADEIESITGLVRAGKVKAWLQSKDTELKAKNEEISNLANTKSHLEGRIQSLQERAQQQHMQVGKLEGSVETINREKSRIEGDLESLKRESSRLETANRECERDQQQRKDEIEDLKRQANNKQTELNDTETKLRTALDALRDAEQKTLTAQQGLLKCQQEKNRSLDGAVEAFALVTLKHQTQSVTNLVPTKFAPLAEIVHEGVCLGGGKNILDNHQLDKDTAVDIGIACLVAGGIKVLKTVVNKTGFAKVGQSALTKTGVGPYLEDNPKVKAGITTVAEYSFDMSKTLFIYPWLKEQLDKRTS